MERMDRNGLRRGSPYRRRRNCDDDDDDEDHDACDERARACNCFDDDNEKRKSKREGDGDVKGLLHRIRSKFFGHSALSLSLSLSAACMACLLGSGSIRFATLM